MSGLDLDRHWLDAPAWDAQGLLPVVAQDAASKRVLMFAFMNRQALQKTVDRGSAVYWSRSRGRFWRKGEKYGHVRRVRASRIDGDGDVLLLSIEQHGGIGCHPGREICFFHQLQGPCWIAADPVLKDPKDIYGK